TGGQFYSRGLPASSNELSRYRPHRQRKNISYNRSEPIQNARNIPNDVCRIFRQNTTRNDTSRLIQSIYVGCHNPQMIPFTKRSTRLLSHSFIVRCKPDWCRSRRNRHYLSRPERDTRTDDPFLSEIQRRQKQTYYNRLKVRKPSSQLVRVFCNCKKRESYSSFSNLTIFI